MCKVTYHGKKIKASYDKAKGIFDKAVGTKTNPATQEQFNEYVDYAYRYANETNVKGNKEFPKQK